MARILAISVKKMGYPHVFKDLDDS